MIDFPSRHASQHDIATILRFVYHSVVIFGPVQTRYIHTRCVLSRYQRSDGCSHLHARNVQCISYVSPTLDAIEGCISLSNTAKGAFK